MKFTTRARSEGLTFCLLSLCAAILLACSGEKEEESEEAPAIAVTQKDNNTKTTYVRKVTRPDLTEDEKKFLVLFEGGMSLTGVVAATDVPDKNHVTLTGVKFIPNESTLALQSMIPPAVDTAILPFEVCTGMPLPDQLVEGKSLTLAVNAQNVKDLRVKDSLLAVGGDSTTIALSSNAENGAGNSLTFCPIVGISLAGESSQCKDVSVKNTSSGNAVVSENVMCPVASKVGVALNTTGGCYPAIPKTNTNSKQIECRGPGCSNLVDYIDPTAQLNSCEASRPKNLTCQGKQLVLRKPWPDCTWACPNEYADDSKPKEPNMTFDTNGNIAYPLEVARPSSPDDLLYNAGQFYDSATGTQLASPNTSDTERLAGSAQTSPDTTSAALERLTAQVVAAAAASMAANSNSTAGTLMCKMQQVGYRRDGKCIHFDSDCPDQKPAGDGWVKGSGCTASELESSANTGMVIVTPATGADHIALPDAPNPGMLDVGPATGVYTPPHSDPNIGMVDAGDSSSSSDCSTGISGRSHGYRSDGITCQEFINECERKNLEASGFTQSC